MSTYDVHPETLPEYDDGEGTSSAGAPPMTTEARQRLQWGILFRDFLALLVMELDAAGKRAIGAMGQAGANVVVVPKNIEELQGRLGRLEIDTIDTLEHAAGNFMTPHAVQKAGQEWLERMTENPAGGDPITVREYMVTRKHPLADKNDQSRQLADEWLRELQASDPNAFRDALFGGIRAVEKVVARVAPAPASEAEKAAEEHREIVQGYQANLLPLLKAMLASIDPGYRRGLGGEDYTVAPFVLEGLGGNTSWIEKQYKPGEFQENVKGISFTEARDSLQASIAALEAGIIDIDVGGDQVSVLEIGSEIQAVMEAYTYSLDKTGGGSGVRWVPIGTTGNGKSTVYQAYHTEGENEGLPIEGQTKSVETATGLDNDDGSRWEVFERRESADGAAEVVYHRVRGDGLPVDEQAHVVVKGAPPEPTAQQGWEPLDIRWNEEKQGYEQWYVKVWTGGELKGTPVVHENGEFAYQTFYDPNFIEVEKELVKYGPPYTDASGVDQQKYQWVWVDDDVHPLGGMPVQGDDGRAIFAVFPASQPAPEGSVKLLGINPNTLVQTWIRLDATGKEIEGSVFYARPPGVEGSQEGLAATEVADRLYTELNQTVTGAGISAAERADRSKSPDYRRNLIETAFHIYESVLESVRATSNGFPEAPKDLLKNALNRVLLSMGGPSLSEEGPFTEDLAEGADPSSGGEADLVRRLEESVGVSTWGPGGVRNVTSAEILNINSQAVLRSLATGAEVLRQGVSKNAIGIEEARNRWANMFRMAQTIGGQTIALPDVDFEAAFQAIANMDSTEGRQYASDFLGLIASAAQQQADAGDLANRSLTADDVMKFYGATVREIWNVAPEGTFTNFEQPDVPMTAEVFAARLEGLTGSQASELIGQYADVATSAAGRATALSKAEATRLNREQQLAIDRQKAQFERDKEAQRMIEAQQGLRFGARAEIQRAAEERSKQILDVREGITTAHRGMLNVLGTHAGLLPPPEQDARIGGAPIYDFMLESIGAPSAEFAEIGGPMPVPDYEAAFAEALAAARGIGKDLTVEGLIE